MNLRKNTSFFFPFRVQLLFFLLIKINRLLLRYNLASVEILYRCHRVDLLCIILSDRLCPLVKQILEKYFFAGLALYSNFVLYVNDRLFVMG